MLATNNKHMGEWSGKKSGERDENNDRIGVSVINGEAQIIYRRAQIHLLTTGSHSNRNIDTPCRVIFNSMLHRCVRYLEWATLSTVMSFWKETNNRKQTNDHVTVFTDKSDWRMLCDCSNLEPLSAVHHSQKTTTNMVVNICQRGYCTLTTLQNWIYHSAQQEREFCRRHLIAIFYQ